MPGPRRLIARAVAVAAFVAGPAVAQASHGAGDEIDVCCAWNGALEDGELTYKIQGKVEPGLLGAAEAGVLAWEGTIPGLDLIEAVGREKADVVVTLKRGGSPFIAGQTSRKFQRLSYMGAPFFAMKGSSISIFGARPGAGLDEIQGTSAHEFGHALGAGHATGGPNSYLIEPVLNDIVTPQACDILAVRAAQQWFINLPGDGPAPPAENHVHCGP